MNKLYLIFILLFFNKFTSYSQTDTTSFELDNLKDKTGSIHNELDEDLNLMTNIGSSKPITLRKSPSILTIITDKEIEKLGARDMMDILRLVPGLDFGMDVQGMTGLGIRGNWSYDGRYLFMIDGQEINEMYYNTMVLGNNQLPANIKQIEIIRGPGSSIYGGLAGGGVINIITKSGADYQGIAASATYGQWNDKTARTNFQLNGGFSKNKLDVSIATSIGKAHRSPHNYTDINNETYNLYNSSFLNPAQVNIGIKYNNLTIRGIYDALFTTHRDAYGKNLSKSYQQNFSGYYFELKNAFKLRENLQIIPKFTYKNQTPWQNAKIDSVDSFFSSPYKNVERYRGGIQLNWDINPQINITSGIELTNDHAKWNTNDGLNKLNYNTFAVFSQSLFKTNIANFTLGARYEKNSIYGDAFVPRCGATRRIGIFNTKLLYSQSFKAPSAGNINLAYNGQIRPELSNVIEIETGFQLLRNWYLNVDLYRVATHKTIVYYIDSLEGYRNTGDYGSKGFETSLKYKKNKFHFTINYSYYTLKGLNTIPDYKTSNENDALGLASHKINTVFSYDIKNFSITPSMSWYGKRYTYDIIDTSNTMQLTSVNPMLVANIFIMYKNILKNKVNIGIGCYDILDVRNNFLQTYNAGHRPLSGTGREWILRINFNFN